MLNSKSLRCMLILLLSPQVSLGFGQLEVEARTWTTMHDACAFPERSGEYAVDYLKTRHSFGIAISGGGTRSAAAALGQLRALQSFGWLEKAMYLSSASGGAWAAVPFTYHHPKDEDSVSEFLGDYVSPEELTEEYLNSPSKKGTLANAIYEIGYIAPQLATQTWWGNEAYGRTISKYFIKPFEIDRKKLFTFTQKNLDRVIHHQQSGLEQRHFVTVSDLLNPPYLIALATAFTPDSNGDSNDIYPVEITPIYTGIRGGTESDAAEVIGGGYIESFAYDATEREESFIVGDTRSTYTIKNKTSRFTLADVVGATGAAPVQWMEQKWYVPNMFFPKFNYQPINESSNKIIPKLVHGDGGHIDNLAVTPLLVRSVQNIIVFINSPHQFSYDLEGEEVSEDLRSFFIEVKDKDGKIKFPFNREIFEDGAEKYDELVDGFANLKRAGRPLVHCDEYTFKESDRFGLRPQPDYKPTICWVYLDRTKMWIDAIREDTEHKNSQLSELIEQRGDFLRFPHFRTFFEEILDVNAIDLEKRHVNALSQLTDWTMRQMKADVGETLGLNDYNPARACTAE